ncbi:exoaminopeptidase [Phycisphaerae bacterium RAS2]|nr:exoaminopeptidase [Phycisphaerae bacterium RAS2]
MAKGKSITSSVASRRQLRILQEMVNLPTAPFVERHVIAYIRAFVAARPALRMTADRFGNLLVTYSPMRKPTAARRGKANGRPILFAAHMDHPGFAAVRMIDARRVEAEFRGWVSTPYFAGEKIQFFDTGRWIPATIERVLEDKPATPGARRASRSANTFRNERPPRGVIARVSRPIAPGSPGMWGLPDARIRGNELHARVCDDIAGLAAVLCMLDEICRLRIATLTYAFFTRAEEVGFAGALAAVEARTVPRKAVVVAVECSKAIAGVQFGEGPVLRVGDKASVFTPAATAYCQVVAEALTQRDSGFRFQRKLMDGGTCESTAYCHHGYDATGICLPLGNYHNMDAARGRIAPEYVDLRDYLNLVKWFVALAQSPATLPYDGRHPGLSKRLDDLLRTNRPKLLKTAAGSRE